jgi:hypothetical protein
VAFRRGLIIAHVIRARDKIITHAERQNPKGV